MAVQDGLAEDDLAVAVGKRRERWRGRKVTLLHVPVESSEVLLKGVGVALGVAAGDAHRAPGGGGEEGRVSHEHLVGARALADQTTDPALAEKFGPIAQALESNEDEIVGELNDAQGSAQDIGGYYQPNPELAAKAMRPSATLNGIIDGI